MAASPSAVYLSLAVLLMVTSLKQSNGQMAQPILTNQARNCECYAYTTICTGIECIGVRCTNIDSVAEVQCAQQILANVTADKPDFPLSVTVLFSDMKVFSDDFFAPEYRILYLELSFNNMSAVPNLIEPACHTLKDLKISHNPELTVVNENVFSSCTSLEWLCLPYNGIDELSISAFSGLSKLQTLLLEGNKLTRFNGLKGLSDLRLFILGTNKLNYVDKNAFQGLSRLSIISLRNNELTTMEDGTFDPLTTWPLTVNLEENPLNCNCSLKWLQQWTMEYNINQWATCASPKKVRVVNADFTNCQSGARINRNYVTEILFSNAMFMFALKYFSLT